MIEGPLLRPVFRPVALVRPGHRSLEVATAAGVTSVSAKRAVVGVLAELAERKAVCYVEAGLTTLKHTTGATSWTCHTWRDRGTRMVHEPTGATFTSLRGALEDDRSLEQVWDDLTRVLSWLREYGVPPGSISSMAWNLWRASLSRRIAFGFDPDVSRAAFYGGRQEVHNNLDIHGRPRVLQNMVAADIRAAYPTSMASRPYGISLRSVSPESRLDPATAGLAEASVDVPQDMPFAPLPVRLTPDVICFQTGRIRGTWAWCELAAAQDLGCTVTVHRSWAPRAEVDLFGPWWQIAQAGRTLGTPGSEELAKAVCNSLWGQFAMNGEHRGTLQWIDDKGERPFAVDEAPRDMPHRWATHIAAETTARVRTRLLTEGLYGDRYYPVHADTDGMIVRASRPVPTPSGDVPGHWRIKAAMRKVDIRAPQLYRWTCGKGCGVTHRKWHYVAAGVTPGSAEAVFDNEGHPGTRISFRGVFDQVIPSTHAQDRGTVAHLLAQAKAMAS